MDNLNTVATWLPVCPKCGKHPYVYDDWSSEKDERFYNIVCLSDECCVKVYKGYGGRQYPTTGWVTSLDEAVRRWTNGETHLE